MIKKSIVLVTFVACTFFTKAQNIGASPEYIKALTSKWTGERFPDGRPKVPDIFLEHLCRSDITVYFEHLGPGTSGSLF